MSMSGPASGSSPESAPEEVSSAPPASPHPIHTPHFRNLWLGASISLLGDQFYLVALPWLVLQLTGSSLALGTILMAAAIPRAALMLLGGAVTDRFSARRVAIVTAAARAIFVGTVATLVWLGRIELWQLYVLTIAFGIADAFSQPAAGVLIPSLVQPQQLQRANSMFQSSAVLSQLLGPAPAGLMIRAWGIASALFFDALSFLAVIVALFRIPDPPKAELPPGQERPNILVSISAGLRSVWRDMQLLSLIVIYAAINLCIAGPIGVGLATVSKFQFGSEAIYGILLTCFSGGLLPGIVLGGMVKQPRRRGLQLIAVSTLTGLELIGMGFALKPVAVGALLVLMGLGVGFVNVQVNVWVQTRVDRSILGRVMSVVMFCAVGLVPLSYAAAGFLAQWNVNGLFIAAGAFLAITTLLMAIPGKGARSID